jgi:hypothetical protein
MEKLTTIVVLLSLLTLVYSQTFITTTDKNMNMSISLQAAECESLDHKIAYFTFCYVKVYADTFQTLNFGVYANDVDQVYIRLIGLFNLDNRYRKIIDTKSVNWCEIMQNAHDNMFLNMILRMVQNSSSNLIHKCPYDGHNEYYNITLNYDMPATSLAVGQYKFIVLLSKQPQEPVLTITVFIEIKFV